VETTAAAAVYDAEDTKEKAEAAHELASEILTAINTSHSSAESYYEYVWN